HFHKTQAKEFMGGVFNHVRLRPIALCIDQARFVHDTIDNSPIGVFAKDTNRQLEANSAFVIGFDENGSAVRGLLYGRGKLYVQFGKLAFCYVCVLKDRCHRSHCKNCTCTAKKKDISVSLCPTMPLDTVRPKVP